MNTHRIPETIVTRQWQPLRCLSALLLLAVSGCVSLPEQPAISTDELSWVLAGADMAAVASKPEAIEEPSSLLALSDEMRRFAQEATRNEYGSEAKAEALAEALSSGNGRRILTYDVDASLTAEQAFQQRRANCLSYTLLFIALAREVGIPAQFNEVDIPPTWDLGDDKTLLLYRHINARINLKPPLFQIIDVSGEEYRPEYDQRTVTDSSALAQFYNNRAVEFRLARRYTEALRYQLRALELLPDAAWLWANLSSLYLQTDHLQAASVAITQALSLDPGSTPSYTTAAQIHTALGNRRLARYFSERAQRLLDRNPYYHFQLALTALNNEDERRAYDETRQAILLNRQDPRFFFLAAVLLERLGESRRSDQVLQIALQLTPDPNQQARYRSKFVRLSAHG